MAGAWVDVTVGVVGGMGKRSEAELARVGGTSSPASTGGQAAGGSRGSGAHGEARCQPTYNRFSTARARRQLLADTLDITLQDTGAGVSADALRTLLDRTLHTLRSASGDQTGVTWRITKASMQSPFSLTIERRVEPGVSEPLERPAERLVQSFAALRAERNIEKNMTLPVARRLADMVELATPSGRRVILQAARGEAIVLDPQWAGLLKSWVHQKVSEQTLPEQPYSTAGRLEGVNVHASKSEFYVYDPLTDQKMRCLFEEPLLNRVAQALGRRVEVSGATKFNAEDQPLRMKVDHLRMIEDRAFLQRLKDAQRRGVMNLTGTLSVEDALEEVRDAHA